MKRWQLHVLVEPPLVGARPVADTSFCGPTPDLTVFIFLTQLLALLMLVKVIELSLHIDRCRCLVYVEGKLHIRVGEVLIPHIPYLLFIFVQTGFYPVRIDEQGLWTCLSSHGNSLL